MDFIDRHWLAPGIGGGPVRAVRGIAPVGLGRPGGKRSGLGAQFGREGIGIGLERQHRPIGPDDPVFVGAPFGQIGDEDFPHPDVQPLAHQMAAVVPIIEIADHADEPGIGRPDREVNSACPLMRDQVRTQFVEQALMGALGNQEIIGRAHHRAKAVGIGDPPFVAVRTAAIFDGFRLTADLAFEQRLFTNAGQAAKGGAAQGENADVVRAGQDCACKAALRPLMHAKQREGIGMRAVQQRGNGLSRWFHSTFQISRAYSLMVRSDENQPTLAMFLMAEVRQPTGSSQRPSTLRWAAA